jgi:hypothetical protein
MQGHGRQPRLVVRRRATGIIYLAKRGDDRGPGFLRRLLGSWCIYLLGGRVEFNPDTHPDIGRTVTNPNSDPDLYSYVDSGWAHKYSHAYMDSNSDPDANLDSAPDFDPGWAHKYSYADVDSRCYDCYSDSKDNPNCDTNPNQCTSADANPAFHPIVNTYADTDSWY